MAFFNKLFGPSGKIQADFNFIEPLICQLQFAYSIPEEVKDIIDELQALWHIPLHIAQGLYSVANSIWFTGIYGEKTQSWEIVKNRIIDNLYSLPEKVIVISLDPPKFDLRLVFPDIQQIVSSAASNIPSAMITSKLDIWQHSTPSIRVKIPILLADYYFFASALVYIVWGISIKNWDKSKLQIMNQLIIEVEKIYREQILNNKSLPFSASVVKKAHKILTTNKKV